MSRASDTIVPTTTPDRPKTLTPPRPSAEQPTPADAWRDEPPWDVAGLRCHMIGVGGCGMSGLARMLAARGALVGGSEMRDTAVTRALVSEGIPVGFDQGAGVLPEGTELVIASAAIRADHPELVAAVNAGLPTLTYAQALGRCMLGRTGVAVAGTHGKSTTVAMLGHVLLRSGVEPTVVVGAWARQLDPEQRSPRGFTLGSERIRAGSRSGDPGVLIAEACEFNRSFHQLRPTIGSIANVEADHLDVYGSLDAVVQAFAGFAQLLPTESEGGRLLIGHDGAHRREITAGLSCGVRTIGFNPAADYHLLYDRTTRRVELFNGGERRSPIASWTNQQPGEHMAFNSAVAVVLAVWLGVSAESAAEHAGAFAGVDRRMQALGEALLPGGGSVRVYDDYGHHPTEIDTTLRALRESELAPGVRGRSAPGRGEDGGRLICVFQPHQHSRTRFLLEEFAQSFAQADVVIVPHIYFVRDSEEEKTRVSAADLVDRLRQRGVRAMHLYPFEAIVEQLQNICRDGDVLVVMGAGPVGEVAHRFVEAMRPGA